MVPDESWTLGVSAKRSLRLRVSFSPEGSGGELRKVLREVAQETDGKGSVLWETVAQYSSVPGFSLQGPPVQFIRALKRLHLRTQVLHPQTSPRLPKSLVEGIRALL